MDLTELCPSLTVVERRSALRYGVGLTGYYITEQGAKNNILVVDISSSGLQFEVDQSEMAALIPHSGSQNSMSPVPLELFIRLGFELEDNSNSTDLENSDSSNNNCDTNHSGKSSTGNKPIANCSALNQTNDSSFDTNTDISLSTAIQIRCGIVYIRRQSMIKCAVGCRFEQFVGDANERLINYLSTHNN